jgi:SulP family sulfate permease
VLLGAAISIVLLLRQASRPRVTELGRVAGTGYFADRVRDPEHERMPGVLVVRCESSLLYFNVEYVRERVMALMAGRPDPVRLVVFHLGSVPFVDLAGAELLLDLHRKLAARGVTLRVADVHGQVRDALRRIGFDREHGGVESGETVPVVIARWLSASPV